MTRCRTSPFPATPDGYPTRGEVIAYLERYESEFNLPVQTNSRVRSLTVQDGRFLLDLGERRIQAKRVVVATGPFQVPRTPAWTGSVAPDVFQIHSSDYRRPSEIPAGTVLVVGGGNTGYQIAKELTVTHEVHLAVGSRQTPLPQRLLGRDLFWWLDKLRSAGKVGRLADRPAGSRPWRRHLDRIEPSPSAPPRRAAATSGREGGGRHDHVRGRQHGLAQRQWFGRPATGKVPLLDRASRRRRRWHSPASAAASATCRACTSWAYPGSTPAGRRCLAGSRTTPSSSPSRSLPTRNQLRERRPARTAAPTSERI